MFVLIITYVFMIFLYEPVLDSLRNNCLRKETLVNFKSEWIVDFIINFRFVIVF